MLIEIKNVFGEVICTLSKKDCTIKDALEEAVRQGVDLCFADFTDADLRCVKLSGVDLRHSTFYKANLTAADLTDTNLYGANFADADLNGALLDGADITNANFLRTKNMPELPMACPKEGSFIGWKKVWKYKEEYEGDFIVKLEIPEDAKRSSATTNKCRCSKAKVLEITSIMNGEHLGKITNLGLRPCVYKVGEYVYPDSFDENRWDECSHGIHFFMNKSDAIHYGLY